MNPPALHASPNANAHRPLTPHTGVAHTARPQRTSGTKRGMDRASRHGSVRIGGQASRRRIGVETKQAVTNVVRASLGLRSTLPFAYQRDRGVGGLTPNSNGARTTTCLTSNPNGARHTAPQHQLERSAHSRHKNSASIRALTRIVRLTLPSRAQAFDRPARTTPVDPRLRLHART